MSVSALHFGTVHVLPAPVSEKRLNIHPFRIGKCMFTNHICITLFTENLIKSIFKLIKYSREEKTENLVLPGNIINLLLV